MPHAPSLPTPQGGAAWYSWRTPGGAVGWILVLGTVIRTLAGYGIGFANGESYYFTSIRHPSWSYFDQPPMAFWLGWLSLRVFGVAERIVLRLPFILLFIGTTWMMYRMGRRLFRPWAGVWAALAFNLSFVFTIPAASWVQPDGPLLFFWMASVLVMISLFFPVGKAATAIEGGSWMTGRWLLLGVCLGCTLLSKYHVLFLIAGAGLFLLTRREQWHWLRKPGPYIALSVTAVFSFPVLYWNMQHDWISFAFQGGRVGGTALRPDWMLTSILGQMVWLLPWVWIPLVWQLGLCARRGNPLSARGDTEHGRERWFCFCTAVLPILFFTAISLWAQIGLHFHWQAPGYMMLFPALGASLDTALRNPRWREWVRRWFVCTVVFSVMALGLMAVHVRTGVWRWFGPAWWAGRVGKGEDPTLEALDYDDLRHALKARGFWEREDLVILSNRWHLAGKADWALRGRWPVVSWSHNSDPQNLAFFTPPQELVGRDAIFVFRDLFPFDPADYAPYFDSMDVLKDVVITRGGRPELTLRLYHARNLRVPIPLPYPQRFRIQGVRLERGSSGAPVPGGGESTSGKQE